ncbi:hypothetical protein K0U83_09665 [bacterium]|nr:hypothetical protein [bacterium]
MTLDELCRRVDAHQREAAKGTWQYRVGHAAGYEAAIRDFWRGVCERLAKEADDESASLEGDSDGYPQMSQRTSDWYRAEAKAKTAEAAQLRAWAKEGA